MSPPSCRDVSYIVGRGVKKCGRDTGSRTAIAIALGVPGGRGSGALSTGGAPVITIEPEGGAIRALIEARAALADTAPPAVLHNPRTGGPPSEERLEARKGRAPPSFVNRGRRSHGADVVPFARGRKAPPFR
jgi:hypothetical protein